MYQEFAVDCKPNKKEITSMIVALVLAVLGVALTFFFWPCILITIISVCFAVWYKARLDYEYEYILTDDELTVDKVIAKSNRKQMASINLKEMELFTNDPSAVQYYRQGGKCTYKNYTGDPGQGSDCWILERTKEHPNLYEITCSPDMIKDIRRFYPQKTKMVMLSAKN